MRRLLTALVLVLGVLPGTGEPASAQTSGLLLGLRESIQTRLSPLPPIPDRYRTLWIAPEGGTAGVLVESPDLLVPRGKVVWRVGVRSAVSRCEFFDQLFALPADREPRFPVDEQGLDPSCRALWGPGWRDQWRYFTWRVNVTFVGPDHIATHQHLPGLSQPERGLVYRIEHAVPWAPVPLAAVLDPSEASSFEEEVRACVLRQFEGAWTEGSDYPPDDLRPQPQPSDHEGSDGPDPSEPREPKRLPVVPRPVGWRVERESGRWVLRAESGPTCRYASCRELRLDVAYPLDPPRAFVGDEPRTADWEAIGRTIPDVTDAFVSPARDMLVALTPGAIRVFSLKAGSVGTQVLQVPISPLERVVMARWATGAEMERWTRLLRSAFAR